MTSLFPFQGFNKHIQHYVKAVSFFFFPGELQVDVQTVCLRALKETLCSVGEKTR